MNKKEEWYQIKRRVNQWLLSQDPPMSSKSEAPSAIVNLRPFPDSHKATSAGTPNKNTREATTDFGKEREYLLFAITLTDHLERCRAEKAQDVKAYNKLKDSGKLREVRNHSKVLIVDSKKDPDGEEVFEVRIPATGKTVWIENKLLK